jgi:tetratricopeptide (TPR) repeat protein
MSADADPNKTEAAAAEPARRPIRPRFPAPQLRIHDRQVYVGFGATPLGDGLMLRDLALIVPDVAFPFDIAGSAATRYQKKQCRFGYLDLELDHELVHFAVRRTLAACSDHVASLQLHLRPGRLEGEGQLHAPGGPAPFTFRIGFQPEGTSVLAVLFDVRLYGSAPLPAPFLAALLARGALRAQAVPSGAPFGAVGLSVDPVPPLLRQAVPLRGFRLPEMGDARLARVEPGPRAFHLHFAANARPDAALDEDLLTAVEGSRSFAEGEALLAQGDLAAAEAYYLRRGEASDAPPFAQERLLGLLAARPDAHDLALDLAAAILRARPGSATAHWVQATLRLSRGQGRAAGESFLKLAALARDRAEEASAFHAFAAAGRALADDAPALASRALQDALACRPDDLGCLLALATAADRAGDAEGAMHAYRRIAALARDPLQASRARVRLAGLLVRLTGDRPAARLQLDAALRQSPDDAEALFALAELCQADGEPLRALHALDQLRRAALEKGDAALESRACLRAGAIWEEALGHLGNALLRYQEAASLAPWETEPALRLAQLHEKSGRTAQALETWQRALVLAEARLSVPSERVASRAAAHRARRALARIARDHLRDPETALAHLEAAAALAPDDAAVLRELLPSWRKGSRAADVERACEVCAAASADPKERSALLAEAGELLQGPLGKPQRAGQLLEQALLLDADCERALGAMASLCESRSDGAGLCRFLVRLSELAQSPRQKIERLQRLSRAARDLAGDLDLAADALSRALALAPGDLGLRTELCALQRRRGDLPALAQALSALAGLLEADGQFAAASRALVELAALQEGPLARPREALGLLERALVLAPEDAQVLRALAAAALRAGKPAAAREALKALLASLPQGATRQERSALLAQLGLACEALGDRAAALEATAAAFTDAPGDVDLGDRLEAMLGAAPGRERDLAAARLARARWARDAGLRAASAGHFARAGQLLARIGEARGALAAFQGALDADPDGPTAPQALDALAQAAESAGDALRASELLARRASFEPEPRAAARLLFRAGALARKKSESLYGELVAKAVLRDDQYPPARASLAALRHGQRDFAQALAHAQAALAAAQDPDALGPDERIALERTAASAAREAGDLEAARDHLARYCAERPADAAALAELADLHRRRGDRGQLIALLPRIAAGAPAALALGAYRELAALLSADPARREESAAAYRRALEIDPDDVASLEGLSALLCRPQEAAERIRLLERRIDLAQEPAQISRLLAEAGDALLGAGQAAKACDAFAKAARAAPEPGRALERLAEAARAAGQVEREVSALIDRAALGAKAREPDAAQRHIAAAARLAELRRPQGAERLLLCSLELEGPEPVRRDALQGLVDLAEARGDAAGAAEYLLRLSELLKGSERAAALVRRAELQRAAGELGPARASLESALEVAPGERRAALALKEVCAELGDLRGTAKALTMLLALPRGDRRAAAALCVELATARERLGERSAAEDSYRRALSYDRSRLDAAQGLYGALLQRGEIQEAMAIGQRLAAQAVDGKDAGRRYAELARLAMHGLSSRPLALGFARRAYERDPGDAPNAALLAESLYLMGATAEALSVHRALLGAAALADVPDRARELRLRLGELAAEAGDIALASSSLTELLADEPHRASAAELLHGVLRRTDPAAALEALARHARALSPSRRAGQILTQLASESRRLGDPAAAARYLALARPCAEDPYVLERARADALREAGLKAELCEALRRVADQARERGEEREALGALDELAALHGALGERELEAAALGEAADLAVDLGQPQPAAERLLRRGLILRATLAGADRLEEAERAFRRSFELAPGRGEAARFAAELCGRRGDLAAQADLVEAAAPLAATPSRAQAFARLARLRLELRQDERAEAASREALALDPSLADAHQLLEELLERQGRFAELATALETRAGLDLPPAERAALLARAGRLFRDHAREPSSAARALRAALEHRAGDWALADECAAALDEAGRGAEARALDERILAADLSIGGAFARQRSRLFAAQEFELLARLLEARAAQESGKAAAGLLLEAARHRASQGDGQGALADERRAFALDPKSDAAFAALQARLGDSDPSALAEVLLARARAVPTEAFELHRSRASLLLRASDRAGAARALDEVLLAAPSDPRALAQRAELAAELEGPGAAEPFDERLLALEPAGAPAPEAALTQARWRLGLLGLGRGAAPTAVQRLEAALEGPLAPAQRRQALEALAACYDSLGERAPLFRTRMAQFAAAADPSEKRRALEGALAAAPDAESERAALAPLCELRPGDAPLQMRLAELLEAASRLEPAADAFEAAAQAAASPESRAQALLRAAGAAQRAGRSERARALRLRASSEAPRDLPTARACLEDLREAGERAALAGALAVLAESDLEPEAGAARLELARLLDAGGEKARAAAAWLAIARRGHAAPGFEESCSRARALFEALGEPALAAEALAARASSRTGGAAAEALLEAARLVGARDPDAALCLLDRASAAAPQSPSPWAERAAVFARRGDLVDRARALVEQARRTVGDVERAALLSVASSLLWEGECRSEALEALRGAVAARPDDASLRIGLLDARQALGDLAGALEELEAARRLTSPEDPGWLALTRRGAAIARELGRADRATRFLAEVFERDPSDGAAFEGARAELAPSQPERWVAALEAREAALSAGEAPARSRAAIAAERGGALLELGRWEAAREALRRALRLDAGCAEAADGLRLLAERSGDADLLAESLEAQAAAAADPAQRFERLMELGRTLASGQGRAAGAAGAYRRARSCAPGPESLAACERALAAALVDASQPREALEVLTARLADPRDRGDPALEELSARACMLMGDRAGARAHLLGALELAPGRAGAFASLASLCDEAPDDLGSALLIRARAAGPGPTRAKLQREAAVAFLSASAADRAESALRDSLSEDPDSLEGFEALASLLESAGRAPELREVLLRRLDRASESAEQRSLLVRLSRAEPASEPAQALGWLERALALAPGSEELLGMLRDVCRGASGEEVEALAERLETTPASHALPGLCLELASDRRDPAESLALLERAARLRPDFAPAHEAALRAARALGDPERALRAIERLLEFEKRLSERGALHREAFELCAALGRRRAGLEHLRQAADLETDGARQRELLARLCVVAQEATDPAALVAAAQRLEALEGPEALASLQVPVGRALAQVGRREEALHRLKRALAAEPDPALKLEVRALAESAGDLATYSEIELELVAALEGEHPAEAAERLRALASRLEASDGERAALLLRRAFELSPSQEDLERQAALWKGAPARALEPLARLARAQPTSAERRRRLADAARAAGDAERADLLLSADGFFEPSVAPRLASLEGIRASDELRAAMADPLARSAIAQLLRAAGPAMGRAFAEDPWRRGLREPQRLGPTSGAALFARAVAAQRAADLPSLEAWLDPSGGVEVELLPGNPDRLVIGLGAAAGLSGAALAFLLLRACELSRAGAAVALEAGADLPQLVRCVLAALGEDVEPAPAFAARVERVRSELDAGAREALARLAQPARAELDRLDAASLLEALRRSAARVAMVTLGDAGAALRATAGAELAAIDPASLAESSPALRDLLASLLRDDLGELRRSCRGETP